MVKVIRNCYFIVLIVFLLISCAAKELPIEVVESKFNAAKSLYNDGYYKAAFIKWESLAKSGDAESAFRIAEM